MDLEIFILMVLTSLTIKTNFWSYRAMKMDKVNYDDLNARQKENYNYHKVASALADYGYDSKRLITIGKELTL